MFTPIYRDLYSDVIYMKVVKAFGTSFKYIEMPNEKISKTQNRKHEPPSDILRSVICF